MSLRTPLGKVLGRGAAGEGVVVRALAASEARGDGPAQREHILIGLDRLRSLEDRRQKRKAESK